MKILRHYLVNHLSVLALLHDVIVSSFVWLLSFLMRFNFELPNNFVGPFLKFLPLVILVQVLAFVGFGMYRGIWRFASIPDLQRIIKAALISGLVIAFMSLLVRHSIIIPRTVLILNPLLLVLMLGGSRFAYRAWKERHIFNPAKLGKPVILIGADITAVSLIKELSLDGTWDIVAIVDDHKNMIGREFSKTRVEGNIASLPKIAKKYGCQHCIIALPNAGHKRRKQIAEIATEANLELLTVPSMSDIMSGKISVSQIRKIDVEDLLGRDVVNLDNQGLSHLISDNVVLVSGAAGSIGSELCRQVLAFNPKKLICVDISEYGLYLLQQEFLQLQISTQIIYIVADIKNQTRIQRLLSIHRPKLVLHAAAYKHVPMMEDNNVSEALTNNAWGTYQFASACQQASVEKFVLISTDKAVNPTNVMGASKRLAELVCQSLQALKTTKRSTKFITVRFGNVLGSSGSVIPKFREQIAKGGPITITHPEITRYFMSIPEAAQLVLQAGIMGQGGEIFVLDMGEPVKIVDLAKDMIKLSGLQPDEISLEFTGLRPGEKLYEELLADDENTLPTNHEKLRIAQARNVAPVWLNNLLKWLEEIPNLTELQIKAQIGEWVEEYQPDQQVAEQKQVIAVIGSQTVH